MPGGNQLHHETSPYLRQHMDNPVHWRAWGPDVLAEARAAETPILLSIGYAACHWCHVMARESFQDPAIAERINAGFIPVKVDREERPDLDAVYQQAVMALGGHPGWPLTLFLTPEGVPFWGGTYFPAEARHGLPGFPDILARIRSVWDTDRATIDHNAEALAPALAAEPPARAEGGLSLDGLDGMATSLLEAVDMTHGGPAGAPKFPQPPLFAFLWRAWKRTGDTRLHTAVQVTLAGLLRGGVWDHLGGGLMRYATDDVWLVPHFEKMLYDNALLLDLLATVGPHDDPTGLAATRADEVVAWLETEMAAPDGGFAASLDAESAGEEGGFYTWTADAVEAVLGADAPFFRRHYDVPEGGNWAGRVILRRLTPPADPPTEEALAAARARLRAERDRRPRPARDDKVLADWNGLAIAALARAGLTFGRPRWVALAREAFDSVRRLLEDGAGRLDHGYRAGQRKGPGFLEDHAAMADAALALHEATGDAAFVTAAAGWMAVADRHHAAAEGGYRQAPADARDVPARPRPMLDLPTPSGNALALDALTRLHALTDDGAYADRAAGLLDALSGPAQDSFQAMPAFLNAAEGHLAGVHVTVEGPANDSATAGLVHAAQRPRAPGKTIARRTTDGPPRALVCRGTTCGPPLDTPEAVEAAVAGA